MKDYCCIAIIVTAINDYIMSTTSTASQSFSRHPGPSLLLLAGVAGNTVIGWTAYRLLRREKSS